MFKNFYLALRRQQEETLRKLAGGYDVFVIDFERKVIPMRQTSIRTRDRGLLPKLGDFVEVMFGGFGGHTTTYLPARTNQTWSAKNFKLFIDMADLRIPQIKEIGDRYANFRLDTTKNPKKLRQNTELAEKDGADYEVVLVDNDAKPRARKLMGASGEYKAFTLTNYHAGLSPYPETLNADELFGEIDGKLRDDLIVEAVLHPLIGLPLVLVREAAGRLIFDRPED